jgi:hypothetical protein
MILIVNCIVNTDERAGFARHISRLVTTERCFRRFVDAL